MKTSSFKVFFFSLSLLCLPALGFSHCDTLDGPVILEAKAALLKGDVTPILKWVAKDDEGEIREAFKRTVALSPKGAEVKEMAEMYFFETLVRVHRAAEGFPYTGLKQSVSEAGPAVLAADRALETGDSKPVAELVTHAVAEGIEKRFERTYEFKKHSGESVEKGREFVASYVDYVHFVEGIHEMAEKSAGHGHSAKAEHGGEAKEKEEHGKKEKEEHKARSSCCGQ